MAATKGMGKDGSGANDVAVDQLKSLKAQHADLERKIAELQNQARQSAVTEILEKIAIFDISASELGFGATRGRPAKQRTKAIVAPKYRDPESGATWSGRGKPPRWIAGRERDEFAI